MNLAHFPASIPGPEGTYALLTDKPEVAVVFVHGFLGDPRKTWYNFPGLVDELQTSYPVWGRSDLFFYSYPSRGQIKPLAEQFRRFLNELFPTERDRRFYPPRQRPQAYALPSGGTITVPTERSEPYKSLILVGHSTGALIVREAALQEIRSLTPSQINSATEGTFILDALLRFFAPAHRGAMCSGTLGALLHLPVSEWLMALMLYSNPLFVSLQQGSPVVEDIKRETEELHDKFPKLSALTALSLFGAKDTIVFVGKYKHDHDYPTEPNHTHVSICKPNKNYLKPLEFVIDAIARTAAGL
ncbi:MAG TPA: alpha/beta fold hydrolase [Candidatus Acidoferrum sp.]|nr:alpha/beta fold hydrolase [Candidatus Acidoferrum sp.]